MDKKQQLGIIAAQIRKMRLAKGFSQEGFAYFIKMNRGFYGRIERGEANLTILNFIKIAKGLKIKVEDLVPSSLYNG